jgi:hypothetical protein
MKSDIIKLLEANGFKKECDKEEPESFWMRKNIKHNFLRNLHITAENHLTVWCDEPVKRFGKIRNSCAQKSIVIYEANFNELKKILEWLRK